MAVNLLLGVGLVEIFVRCGVEVIDQLLMLGIEFAGEIDLELFARNDAFQLLGRLAWASTIICANPLTGADCPFWLAILPASISYMSLMAAFCTKSDVLGAPPQATRDKVASATIASFRIVASKRVLVSSRVNARRDKS